LIVFEKPVPEKSYITLSKIWGKDAVSTRDKVELSKVYLTLMGKYSANRKNIVLKKAFTSTVISLSEKDSNIISAKEATSLLGLSQNSLLGKVVPYALIPGSEAQLSNEELQTIPAIMKKYLIHNRSFLTDTIFLGFPFHYFYTAVFLLILFVTMCWTYCFVIQKVTLKFGINEDDS
jgi:putative solute:sodium symporter small subunit